MEQQDDTPLYERLGGEVGLRRIVDRFYELMDTLPSTKAIRDMHPPDLKDSADKLFWFMSGWTGGPPLFHEKRGHPMLRRRHFPFTIGKSERDQWMLCMVLSLEETVADEQLREFTIHALFRLADHMRNQPEPDGESKFKSDS